MTQTSYNQCTTANLRNWNIQAIISAFTVNCTDNVEDVYKIGFYVFDKKKKMRVRENQIQKTKVKCVFISLYEARYTAYYNIN